MPAAREKKRAYVLMTAAHNEEAFIEKTIASVLTQTEQPRRWVIVSDGSTDGTNEIVESYASQCESIYFLKLMRSGGHDFGSKGRALQHGAKALEGIPFDFIGNLDADIVLEPQYFEALLDHFERDARLGISAGFVYEVKNGEYRSRTTNRVDSVAHAAQLVRHECYSAIGGYSVCRYGGEDWYAQQSAKMHGWRAEAIPSLKVFHERHTGAGNNLLRHHFRAGRLAYSFGSSPVFEFLKCGLRLAEDRPLCLGGISRWLGYLCSAICRDERPVSQEFIEFLRKEQTGRLLSIFHRRGHGRFEHANIP